MISERPMTYGGRTLIAHHRSICESTGVTAQCTPVDLCHADLMAYNYPVKAVMELMSKWSTPKSIDKVATGIVYFYPGLVNYLKNNARYSDVIYNEEFQNIYNSITTNLMMSDFDSSQFTSLWQMFTMKPSNEQISYAIEQSISAGARHITYALRVLQSDFTSIASDKASAEHATANVMKRTINIAVPGVQCEKVNANKNMYEWDMMMGLGVNNDNR